MGTTTMPIGERRICGMGLRVTWPPSNAVGSPPSFAAKAWEASWHVVERRKAMYQTAPRAITVGSMTSDHRLRASGKNGKLGSSILPVFGPPAERAPRQCEPRIGFSDVSGAKFSATDL